MPQGLESQTPTGANCRLMAGLQSASSQREAVAGDQKAGDGVPCPALPGLLVAMFLEAPFPPWPGAPEPGRPDLPKRLAATDEKCRWCGEPRHR